MLAILEEHPEDTTAIDKHMLKLSNAYEVELQWEPEALGGIGGVLVASAAAVTTECPNL